MTNKKKMANKEKQQTEWKLTAEEKPMVGSNIEYSEDGVTVEGTMDYIAERTCMLAGVGGGNGYFGEGFATDGSTGCEHGLILDEPKYWRYENIQNQPKS